MMTPNHYRDLVRYQIGYEITWALLHPQGERSAFCQEIMENSRNERLMIEEVVRTEDGRKQIVCRPNPFEVTRVADQWTDTFLQRGMQLDKARIPELEEGLRFFTEAMRELQKTPGNDPAAQQDVR